ncbi:hypothetical protein [Flavobacterium sp.]|uniref:hypothetical protein n=1 Tax=Flavobacterium sp. TaxID=239 RepID=UPI0026291AED|nr:hypothetical protein [Flavobacterium sp.]
MTPEQIRLKLEEMAKNNGPAVSNIAKVKSVNIQNSTCILVDEDGQEIFNVRLKPILNNNKSFVLIPKIGTNVLALRIEDDDDWMVIAADEIEKIGYYINDVLFEIDQTGFLLKKENETLKKIMVDLVSAIKGIQLLVTTTGTSSAQSGQTTAIVNLSDFEAIESRINDFLN